VSKIPSENSARAKTLNGVTLELTVDNHPGVMSHICGLFSRRAFNVEKILCLPEDSGERSRIWLTVHDDERLDQLVKQLEKLLDVREIRNAGRAGDLFGRIEETLKRVSDN